MRSRRSLFSLVLLAFAFCSYLLLMRLVSNCASQPVDFNETSSEPLDLRTKWTTRTTVQLINNEQLNDETSVGFEQTTTDVAAANLSASSERVFKQYAWILFENRTCSAERQRPFIQFVVHTAPKHFKRRQLIRETWGSAPILRMYNLTLVFAMGAPPPTADKVADMRLQRRIVFEQDKYGDIIQQDFHDTYRNLTHKAIMWLHWVKEYCPGADLVVKLDDDVFVNPFTLVPHLRNMVNRRTFDTKTFVCYVVPYAPVDRNKDSKWYVSPKEFPKNTYETYCMGSAYVIPNGLIAPLAAAAETTPFFWIDDYWVTGKLGAVVGAKHHQAQSMFAQFVYRGSQQHIQHLLEGYGVFAHLPAVSLTSKYRLWKTLAAQSGYLPKADF